MIKLFKTKDLISILIATAMLCFWGIYNGFPLTFNSDSAVYLEAAFNGIVGEDRPILYGLFLVISGFWRYLWPAIIVQSLLLSSTIYLLFKYFSTSRNYLPYFLCFVALISFFMGGSFIASWLMPDVFTPISILCLGYLLFINEAPKKNLVFVSMLLVISTAMHNTHFFIGIGLLIVVISCFAIKPFRKQLIIGGIKIKRVGFALLLVIISNLFLSTVHYAYNSEFIGSRGGAVFLMGNLVEMGIVDIYLADNCKEKKYEICQYDTLPNNFLWAGNSPLKKAGGWEHCKTEYTTIVKDILTTPKYLIPTIYKSLILTIKQFFLFDTGEASMPSPRVDLAIAGYYPNLYTTFIRSREYRGTLDFHLTNFIQTVIFGFSLLIYIILFLNKKVLIKYKLLMVYILLALVINAWFCGTFSGVYPRYQDRLTCLLPMPLFIYCMENIDSMKVRQYLQRNVCDYGNLKSKLAIKKKGGHWHKNK